MSRSAGVKPLEDALRVIHRRVGEMIVGDGVARGVARGTARRMCGRFDVDAVPATKVGVERFHAEHAASVLQGSRELFYGVLA